jgi:hypothetical protein
MTAASATKESAAPFPAPPSFGLPHPTHLKREVRVIRRHVVSVHVQQVHPDRRRALGAQQVADEVLFLEVALADADGIVAAERALAVAAAEGAAWGGGGSGGSAWVRLSFLRANSMNKSTPTTEDTQLLQPPTLDLKHERCHDRHSRALVPELEPVLALPNLQRRRRRRQRHQRRRLGGAQHAVGGLLDRLGGQVDAELLHEFDGKLADSAADVLLLKMRVWVAGLRGRSVGGGWACFLCCMEISLIIPGPPASLLYQLQAEQVPRPGTKGKPTSICSRIASAVCSCAACDSIMSGAPPPLSIS